MVTEVLGLAALPAQEAGAGSSFAIDLLNAVFRWLHILAGVVWIGHLYFFNFVNANFAPTLDGDAKRKVVPQLMPRALFWFRMGAALTWVTGVLLFLLVYVHGGLLEPQTVLDADGGTGTRFPARTAWILLGGLFGTIMAYNVWFVIWPRQQRIITAVRDGQAPDPAQVKTATLASKVNTYLSVPLLLTMVSNSIPTLFDWEIAGSNHLVLLLVVLLGFLLVWGWYKFAPSVKGF